MIFTSIELDKPGRQSGFLQAPYSHNLGGWANVMIPITVVARGKGPTVLVLGGNHGDEYQGQIAIMKLARRLTPEITSIGTESARACAIAVIALVSPGPVMTKATPGLPEARA